MTILYSRKSTESEDRQVLSIESQISELSKIARKNNLALDSIITESKSAKSPGRPEFNRMIELIEKSKIPITLFAWKLDRLARNPIDGGKIIWLLEKGLIKEIVTYEKSYFPTDNVLLMYVELGMANQFLKDLSVNVKRGIKSKLGNGGWIAKAPIGYLNDRLNHTVYPDPIQSKYIIQTFEMFATGAYSPKQVAGTLYEQGFRTNRGFKIHTSKIYHILNNPFYAGMMRVKGVLHAGNYDPLISQELFDTCQRIFSPNRSRKQKHSFPFRGFMTCAECGCLLTATTKKGFVYYYCTNGKKICTQHKRYMRKELVEELLGDVFSNLSFDSELIEIMYLAAKEKLADQNNYHLSAQESIQNEIKSLSEKINRLEEVYLDGSMDKDRYNAKLQEFRNNQATLNNQLKQIKPADPYATLEQTKKAFLTAFNAEKDFLCADDSKKSELVKTLLWNASIKDQNVQCFKLKQPFQLIAEAPKTDDIFLWQGL